MINVGFIGTGNMGGALAAAVAKSEKANILLYDNNRQKAAELADTLSHADTGDGDSDSGTAKGSDNSPSDLCAKVCVCNSSPALIKESRYVFIGVKPQHFGSLASEIKDELKKTPDKIIISMMAGTPMDAICRAFETTLPIIRIMPNMPASSGKGMILYTHNNLVKPQDLSVFLDFLAPAGEFAPLDEKLFAAGTAISGCGPAFLAMFVEALADGGVACGLPRQTATLLATQVCLGTAFHMQKNDIHPGILKDSVCSPGGTTIEGVRTLEDKGFRSAVIEAVIKTQEKDGILNVNNS